jgi:hypothetical protein
MPTERFEVGEKSRPEFIKVLTRFWDDSDPAAAADITGFAIELVVKRDVGEDTDAQAIVRLMASIISAVDGKYGFTFTTQHTGYAAGSYTGEIRVWRDGVMTNPPHYIIPVQYTIVPAVDFAIEA